MITGQATIIITVSAYLEDPEYLDWEDMAKMMKESLESHYYDVEVDVISHQ